MDSMTCFLLGCEICENTLVVKHIWFFGQPPWRINPTCEGHKFSEHDTVMNPKSLHNFQHGFSKCHTLFFSPHSPPQQKKKTNLQHQGTKAIFLFMVKAWRVECTDITCSAKRITWATPARSPKPPVWRSRDSTGEEVTNPSLAVLFGVVVVVVVVVVFNIVLLTLQNPFLLISVWFSPLFEFFDGYP